MCEAISTLMSTHNICFLWRNKKDLSVIISYQLLSLIWGHAGTAHYFNSQRKKIDGNGNMCKT